MRESFDADTLAEPLNVEKKTEKVFKQPWGDDLVLANQLRVLGSVLVKVIVTFASKKPVATQPSLAREGGDFVVPCRCCVRKYWISARCHLGTVMTNSVSSLRFKPLQSSKVVATIFLPVSCAFLTLRGAQTVAWGSELRVRATVSTADQCPGQPQDFFLEFIRTTLSSSSSSLAAVVETWMTVNWQWEAECVPSKDPDEADFLPLCGFVYVFELLQGTFSFKKTLKEGLTFRKYLLFLQRAGRGGRLYAKYKATASSFALKLETGGNSRPGSSPR